jgi:regulator of replication initiation timing
VLAALRELLGDGLLSNEPLNDIIALLVQATASQRQAFADLLVRLVDERRRFRAAMNCQLADAQDLQQKLWVDLEGSVRTVQELKALIEAMRARINELEAAINDLLEQNEVLSLHNEQLLRDLQAQEDRTAASDAAGQHNAQLIEKLQRRIGRLEETVSRRTFPVARRPLRLEGESPANPFVAMCGDALLVTNNGRRCLFVAAERPSSVTLRKQKRCYRC